MEAGTSASIRRLGDRDMAETVHRDKGYADAELEGGCVARLQLPMCAVEDTA